MIMGAERLLSAREERQRAAAATNTARWTATVRFEAASSALAAAEAAALKEAGRGGCKERVPGSAGRSRAGASASRSGQFDPSRHTGREEQGTARHDARASSGAPGDRARAAVLDGAEWTCVHTAGVRSPCARRKRCGIAERRLPTHRRCRHKVEPSRCAPSSRRTANDMVEIRASATSATRCGCRRPPLRSTCGRRWPNSVTGDIRGTSGLTPTRLGGRLPSLR